jgi:carboxylesterase type B
MMAADNVATTSLYSCPIHKLLEHTPFGEAEQDMYVFEFARHDPEKPDALITHSCELNYLFDPDFTSAPEVSS